MTRSIPFLLGLLLLALGCAQRRSTATTEHSTDPRWVPVDSLAAIGQYATALELTGEILQETIITGDWRARFRAQQYRSRFLQMTGVDQAEIIREQEDALLALGPDTMTNIPLRQLMHSVLAEAYWTCYQQNRWRILDRTNVEAPAGSGEDITTWDQRRFMQRIIHHYQSSLQPFPVLRAIPAGDLGELLQWPYDSPRPAPEDEYMRSGAFEEPLLIDILARRALAVLTNSEARLAEPDWRFKIDDPRWFQLFEYFARRPLEHRDSLSWEFQAMRTWQLLEKAHLSDDHPIILTDIMLSRLAYVRRQSDLPEKDSLYYEALLTMRSGVEQLPVYSEVTAAMARWHAEQGEKFQRLEPEEYKWERRTALQLCEAAIERFPDSFGAQKARLLKHSITAPAIDLQMEDAVLPDAPFKLALGYRNVQRVWLRIVQDEISVQDDRRWGQDEVSRLLQRRVVRQWSVELPDDGDLHRHLVELPAEALPAGRYAVLASPQERMRVNEDNIAFASFWCTSIAVAERSTDGVTELLLLDRQSGRALTGAKATLYTIDHEGGGRSYKAHETIVADADGWIRHTRSTQRGSHRWWISHGQDTYITAAGWYWGRHDGGERSDSIRTFLFTDRAIYRPGQEIFFKGITTVRRGGTTVVKAERQTLVRIYDVNGQMVDSASVISDVFGSYHGSFRAPAGLTGHMRIEEEHGSQGFLVEEYKRPGFEVLFDPITTTARLNGQAQVTGMARSYAGVALPGSGVRWTVKRIARMPWWMGHQWGGFPGWGRPVEIASGTTTTDVEGRFVLEFTASADRQLPRRAEPVFTFTVEAVVTDMSGETRAGNTSLSLGYRSIQVDLDMADALDRSATGSLGITVRNLNGEPAHRPVDVRVSRLDAPMLPLRKRKWERPDRHVITADAHAALFPFDPYDAEDDPLKWPEDSLVLERTQWHSGEDELALTNISDWPVGKYSIEVRTLDPDGQEVVVRKPFTLYDPGIQNTGFLAEALHVEHLDPSGGVQPGERSVMLVSTAMAGGRMNMEVERDGRIVVSRWFTLQRGQQLVELPVTEEDRGGFAVHFMGVSGGREFKTTINVDVPWSNKELQVEWLVFRDKMLPGSKEEFRLKITGAKGGQVAAQVLAGMYDASLDHFTPHQWNMHQWPEYGSRIRWDRLEPFSIVQGMQFGGTRDHVRDTTRALPDLRTFDWPMPHARNYMNAAAGDGGVRRDMLMDAAPAPMAMERAEAGEPDAMKVHEEAAAAAPPMDQPVRTDLRETAFFLPDLFTDRDGSVVLRFTMPEALTRWKLMGLAHTEDLQVAQFEREIVTRKPLMVVPNLPRFLREGDHITLVSRIDAVEAPVSGSITLELFDPVTNEITTTRFSAAEMRGDFTAAPGAPALARWPVSIVAGMDMVGIRIIARGSDGMSDGEEHVLPVLSDRLLVTESLPLPMRHAGTRTFTMDKLKNNTSNTLRHHSLKLEFTPNPAWYAVQALPYLIEFPHECSEQVFSRYYANKLSAHIVEQKPGIRRVVDEWMASAAAGGTSMLSALEKDPGLKSILLEETPWVMRALRERERKGRLVLLFDLERMAREEAASLRKLQELQRPDGAWPWFSGMFPSRGMTQHIVAGFGHLQRLGAYGPARDVQTRQMLDKAIQWLDQEAGRWYRDLQRNNTEEQIAKFVPGHTEIQYLHARSYFTDRKFSAGSAQAARFIRERITTNWTQYGLQEQIMIALVLHRFEGQGSPVPELVLRSLKERATQHDELGMYWKHFTPGMEWTSFPTETHSIAIEAFHEITSDVEAINGLRVHLLKLKQTTDWRTTKATASACYALLLTGDELLDEAPAPVITVGGQSVDPAQQEAGTGYFSRSWDHEQVRPRMGEVTITAQQDRVAWGALHWQYFEQMDKITAHESPFNIRKEVMLRRQTDEGGRLITLEQAGILGPGDRLTIRIELRTDRYVDFVHLKDLRASGLEPVEAISGHKWQGGLGYYQSIRDASMNFFFDRIPPGTHVFEYELNVAHAGDFSNGITTAMCMYAPEFSSHSAGQRIVVGEQ